MSLDVWTKSSGYKLGSFTGEKSYTIPLPVTNDSGVTYRVISGALPKGMFLVGNTIVGSGFTVKHQLDYSFCIRASKLVNNRLQLADRTFTMTVTDPNVPVFLQAAGALDIGPAHQLYVLDSTFVDYQILVEDLNLEGGSLKFYIASGDGTLPKGLTLSDSGVISGYIEPTPAITFRDGIGAYDSSIFDHRGYDFGIIPTDGFDDYAYDNVTFDFNIPTTQPITLNVNYQFKVTVTDGVNTAQRIFRIFVVGNDEFRADSTTLNGLADEFSADATYIRQPVWITNPNLGVFRANNYLTIPVALYDNSNVEFRLESTNQEIYVNAFQVANTDNIIGSAYVTITNVSDAEAMILASGLWFNFEYYLEGGIGQNYQIASVADLGGGTYRLTISTVLAQTIPNGTPFYIGTLCELPVGTSFDPATGDVYGVVPYQPTVTKKYVFTLTATRAGDKGDLVSTSRTFNITVIGDINSIITWQTPTNLGTIDANYICTLSVLATSNIPDSVVIYTLTPQTLTEKLPPGLSLNTDGEIIGMVNQFYNPTTLEKGLITFDGGTTTFDNKTTTFDRQYTFTITASDQYGFNQEMQTFTLTIGTPNTVNYSHIVVRPFLEATKRNLWKKFINNPTIFVPSTLYRLNDPSFGIQTDLKVLVYAGIETREAAVYVSAMGLNTKRKRFLFDTVKKAIAIDPQTGASVYEAIYVQMVDPLEPNGVHLPRKVVSPSLEPDIITVDETHLTGRPNDRLTVDSTGYEASNPKIDTYFPNSITNWRDSIENWKDNSGVGIAHERNYLPLWMRSIPKGEKQQLNYVLALPLCFCKPGEGDTVLRNIKASGFNFSTLDYVVDRFIITAVTGYNSDKYLAFKNDRITV